MNPNETNWAGNLRYSAATTHQPQTQDELRHIVARTEKIKPLGTRHSFNQIADSSHDHISLSNLNRVIEIDQTRHTVTVEAGIKYGQLGEHLHRAGYALRNLASLPHISVAGACATATHGSGDANANLATAVTAMELVTADGDIAEFSRQRHGPQFDGMVVALGAIGIVSKLTLEIVPSFQIRQHVYENLSWTNLQENFDAITASAYSVSVFTDWHTDHVNQVWLKQRVNETKPPEAAPTFFGATLAPVDRHPISAVSAENCTTQCGIPGPWHERLPHFRMDFTPSNGNELQTEYFVPRENAPAAFAAVAQLRAKISPLLFISELRTIAADTLWMSPCYRRASAGIHFTWKPDWPNVQKVLPLIESALTPFGMRPHWAKLFTLPPARLRSLYEKFSDFQQLAQQFDRRGKFRNSFLDTYIFGS